MRIEDREAQEKKILNILKNGWISTTELSIRSKINYYRLKLILARMRRNKLIKSKKGKDKRGSVYWTIR